MLIRLTAHAFGVGALLLVALMPAQAQQAALVVASCGAQSNTAGKYYPITMDETGNLCTGAGGGGGNVTIVGPFGAATSDAASVAVTDGGTLPSGVVLPTGGTGMSGVLGAIYNAATQPTKILDTGGTNVATVKAAATPPAGTDTSLVVAINPNSTVGSTYGNQANWVSGSASATTTGSTSIIGAPISGSLYITSAQCFRTDLGDVASYVTFNDGASTVMGLPNSGSGAGNNMIFATPLIVASTTALKFASSGNISTVYCNAQGYNAP